MWKYLPVGDKPEDAEDMPSMDEKAAETSEKRPINIISSYVSGDKEDDVPDMEEFEDADNLYAKDAVRLAV
jgi:ubiquitin-like-conjugating enzyme ATG3